MLFLGLLFGFKHFFHLVRPNLPPPYDIHRWKAMDLGFNLAQSNRDLKDPASRQNFGDTSGLLCKNDLIPCRT